MQEINLRFFSIVFLGDFNPPILNHDFLTQNKILPEDDSHFGPLLKRAQAVDGFQSFPGFSAIRYGPYSITVELTRFQIRDDRERSNFDDSPAVELTKRYFSTLSYTPIRVGGFNLNYLTRFKEIDEKRKFLDCILAPDEKLYSLFGSRVGRDKAVFTFPFLKGQYKFDIGISNQRDQLFGNISINYEFKFDDFPDMASFLGELDNVTAVETQFQETLRRFV